MAVLLLVGVVQVQVVDLVVQVQVQVGEGELALVEVGEEFQLCVEVVGELAFLPLQV